MVLGIEGYRVRRILEPCSVNIVESEYFMLSSEVGCVRIVTWLSRSEWTTNIVCRTGLVVERTLECQCLDLTGCIDSTTVSCARYRSHTLSPSIDTVSCDCESSPSQCCECVCVGFGVGVRLRRGLLRVFAASGIRHRAAVGE